MMRFQSASFIVERRHALGRAGGVTMMSTAPNCLRRTRRAAASSDAASRDVRRHAQRAAAAALDLGGDLVDERRAPAGGDDVGAGVGEAEREGAADAAGAADDDGQCGRTDRTRLMSCEVSIRRSSGAARGGGACGSEAARRRRRRRASGAGSCA